MFAENVLAGRVVVVTGGGTGLGRAMALHFARYGAKVGIIGRRTEPLEATVADMTAAGAVAAWASADVRDPESVHAAFDGLEAKLGPLDTLINNAAGNFLSPTEDLSPNAFNAVIDIVLRGTFHCTQDFGRRVIADEARRGVVLNITTTYAWMGSPFVLPSACAKAGVHAMTKSLAVEWATYGMRFVDVAPGPFPTEGASSRLAVPGMDQLGKDQNPTGRFGKPEELANLATYLISDQASYINGATVPIDGGEWLLAGQSFGLLARMDRDNLKQMMTAMRPKK